MTNLDSILRSRDITLPTKAHLVKAMVFSVVMYGGESWTIKKGEHQKINAFELCCWRRLFSVPWTERGSNLSVGKSILNIQWKDWCWSWNLNTLATWCKELTHWKRPWFWERLKAGGERDYRGWAGWMALPTQWTWVWASSGRWWRTGKPGVLQFMVSQRAGHNWATEQRQHTSTKGWVLKSHQLVAMCWFGAELRGKRGGLLGCRFWYQTLRVSTHVLLPAVRGNLGRYSSSLWLSFLSHQRTLLDRVVTGFCWLCDVMDIRWRAVWSPPGEASWNWEDGARGHCGGTLQPSSGIETHLEEWS